MTSVRAFVFPRMFGEALTPPMAADLVPLARDWGPDLLVHENAELAAPLAGAVCAVPSVTHSFGTAVPVPILDDTRERLAGLWSAHGLEVPPYAGCFGAGYLDICPPSVQTTSVDHIAKVQPLRPATVSGPTRAPAEPLVYVTLGTVQSRPDLLREVVAGVAGARRPGAGGARAPDRSRRRWGSSRPTCRWSRGSTRTPCSTGARRWSRTAAPAPSWAPWRGACPSSACRRRPTSSATPRAGSGPAPPSSSRPPRPPRPRCGPRSRGCSPTRSCGRRAERVAAEIAAMPGPDEVVRLLA